MTVPRAILHSGFTCFYFIIIFFHFAPETSTEVPNADNLLVFFVGKIYTTRFPLGVLGTFLSFPLLREKLLLILSVYSFLVCHFKTFLSVTCMSLFRDAGG